MKKILADIPDYDKELERLSGAQSFDIESSFDSFMRRLFYFDVNPIFFEIIKILALVILAVVVFWFIYKEFNLNGIGDVETNDVDIPQGGFQGNAADADIRGHSFERELKEALSREDYAEAVRLRYLYTLQQLNSMKYIEWTEWKTPLMYVDELEGNAELLKELTMTFLYIKYGHYPATKDMYDHACMLNNHLVITGKGGMA